MLQYRENINYSRDDDYNIDQELDQLIELLKDGIKDYDIYDAIRQFIYRQIKIKELAVTIILSDLHELRKTRPRTADLIEYFISHNNQSYADIGREFNCSKQNVHNIITHQAENFIWLDNLVKIKGEEDSKNDNKQKSKKEKQIKYLEQVDKSFTEDLFKLILNDNKNGEKRK